MFRLLLDGEVIVPTDDCQHWLAGRTLGSGQTGAYWATMRALTAETAGALDRSRERRNGL